MLPSKIVGSVESSSGQTRPFVLDVATGAVTLGAHAEADPMQAELAAEEQAASESRVRSVVGDVRRVRLGAYRCSSCQRWVDVVRQPARWSGDRCAACKS